MSNSMDHFLLSNVPHIADFQKATAHTVETRIDEAIRRMRIAVSDSYDNVSVFSIYWKSDDTGGAEDSPLFVQTISKLQNVQACQRSLSDDDTHWDLGAEIGRAAAPSGSRKLFILHYAGHAVAGSTSDTLVIIPTSDRAPNHGSEMKISTIKDGLKDMSSKFLGLDVLFVMDCCCAAIAGRGEKAGGRVELMAATARRGTSNARQDGWTFTQHWCKTFTELLEEGKPFTCNDIVKAITFDPDLQQFPPTFVLHEGSDLPITFCLRPGEVQSLLPSSVTFQTIVVAFHIEDDLDSPLLQATDWLPREGASTDHCFSGAADIQYMASAPHSHVFARVACPSTSHFYVNRFLVALEGL